MRSARRFAPLFAALAACGEPDAARRILERMDLEERVGQLVMPRAPARFRNDQDPEWRRLLDLAAAGRIGGAVVFAGTPEGTRNATEALREASAVPPLIAADYEWGTAMRTEGGVRFPPALQAGASPDPEALYRQGAILAREARAVGVHLVLAPVLDVLQTPESAVIGIRSFGADPAVVGELGAALIRGIEENGALATAKHFPGHGGTATDSHHRLAQVLASREHLDRVDLAPFREAIRAGVAAVMPGHLAVPALDGRADRPAVLSPEILGGLLRGEMGFRGLVVSDALEMEGARDGRFDGEVAVAAVAAGVDVVLVPKDPLVAHQALARAARQGRLSEERIAEAALRVLRAKERLGLLGGTPPAAADLRRSFADPADREWADSRFREGLTLVRDPGDWLPLTTAGGRTPAVFLVEISREGPHEPDRRAFRAELRRRGAWAGRLSTGAHGALPLETLEERAADADLVLLADYRRYGAGLPEELRRALDPYRERLVAVSFGNPVTLRDVHGEATALLAWDGAEASQRAAAQALFGEVEVSGRLPIPLGPHPQGAGMDQPAARQRLQRATTPGEAGMSAEGIEAVRQVIRDAIAAGTTPGASAIVVRRGRIALHEGFGRQTWDEGSPAVTPDTIYDLASLTKVVGTTTLVMMLVEDGLLDIGLPVSAYLPEFLEQAPSAEERERRQPVTVADLLAHSSGLPAWIQFYLEFDPDARGLPRDEARRRVLDRIFAVTSDYEPRTDAVYSDNGLLLLGEIIERVSGAGLETLVRDRIFRPLGMEDTGYRPDPGLLPRIAPTEDNPWRGRLVHGQVHDENTVLLGEVAAHAGLFSATGDLAVFLQMLLNGGSMEGRRLLRGDTIARFTRRARLVPGSSRALGWDTPSRSASGGPSSAGDFFSASSFGHTGFTGTSIWVDPERELFAVLLTNRVHPTRENDGIFRLRPAFHDAVARALTDFAPLPRSPPEG